MNINELSILMIIQCVQKVTSVNMNEASILDYRQKKSMFLNINDM